MTPSEKAKELIVKFKNHVNPYIGSGMLSNTHDDDAILWQCKKCALICIDYLISHTRESSKIKYWKQCNRCTNQGIYQTS